MMVSTQSSPTRHATENPATLFAQWFEAAKKTGIKDPSAVFLATASAEGAPSCRVVLLQSFDEQGFVFYTNTHSRAFVPHHFQFWQETDSKIPERQVFDRRACEWHAGLLNP